MSSVPLSQFISLNAPSGINPLWDAILEGPIDREEALDHYCCERTGLKVAQLTISLAANASYLPIILHAGIPMALGNFVSFFALDYWAVEATLKDALGPRGEREMVLIGRNSRGALYRWALTVGSLGLSILAVAPLALPVLDYDGNLRITGMIVVFLGGSILPLRSIQLSLNQSIQMQSCVLGVTGKKLEGVRFEMVSLLANYRGVFESLGMDEKLQFVARHARIRDLDDLDRVGQYVSSVFEAEDVIDALVAQTRCQWLRGKLWSGVQNLPGVWLAASLETALTLYTFDRAKNYVTENDMGAGILTAITIGSGIFLNGKSIVSTTHRFACGFFNGLRCRRNAGLSEQLRPKLSACLKLLGLTLNLGTFGSSIVIFGDFFKDNLSEKLYFEVTLCAAYFILTATATLDLVEGVISQNILNKGTADEQQIMQLHVDLGRLKELLEKSSLVDLSLFILSCPARIKDRLVNKVNLSYEEINRYLERKRIVNV